MQADQADCIARVLASEGGYTNHPADPGGPTNFGITIADYRKYVKPDATAADVRSMQVDDAKTIYRARYWDALCCDTLPPGLDYAVFDYGVNSGISRAGKVLRRIVGQPDTDWHVTDAVTNAVGMRASKAIITAICDERLAFLRGLKIWPVFGAGWARRVAEVKAAALHMADFPAAATAHNPRPAASSPMAAMPAAKGHVPASKLAPTVIAGGAAAAAGGGLLHWMGAHPADAAIAAFGVAVLVGAILAVMHRSQQVKQTAPTPNTPAVPVQAAA